MTKKSLVPSPSYKQSMKGLYQVGKARKVKTLTPDSEIDALESEYLAQGGRITKCPEDSADNAWEPRLLNYAVRFGKRHGMAA